MTALRFVVACGLVLCGAVWAQEVAPTAEDIRPLLVGSEVPDVMVKTVEGSPIALREAIGGQPTVLVFYRGGWCPFCSKQLADLRHSVQPLRELGVQMIGISGDSSERLQSYMGDEKSELTVLADYELEASKAFGLAFKVSDEYVEKLAQYKLDVTGNSVSSQQVLPVPGVFVIGADNVIAFSYVNPNYRVRCDANVILAAAAALTKQP